MRKELFKSVNEKLFKSIKGILWLDKEGIKDISADIYVSFRLDDVGTHDSFNGVHVDIYSRSRGVLKKKFFRFSDYLNINHLWYQTNSTPELEWYTVVRSKHVPAPTTLEMKKFCDEIEKYIKLVV